MAIEIIKTFYNGDNFVFIPACCYNGNQFFVSKQKYLTELVKMEVAPAVVGLFTKKESTT